MEKPYVARLLHIFAACVFAGAAAYGAEPLAEKGNDDTPKPFVSRRAGFLLFSRHHNFYVDSQWGYPLFCRGSLGVWLGRRATTPFLDTAPVMGTEFQVEMIHAVDTLRWELEMTSTLALKSVQRYEHTMLADRPGRVSGFELGVGLGTPNRYRDSDWLAWEIIAGPVFKMESLDANWFLRVHGFCLARRWAQPAWLHNVRHFDLTLDADIESVNQGCDLRPLVEVGPTLRIQNADGGQLGLFAHWFQSFSHPFAMRRDGGLLAGFQFDSWDKPLWGHDALDFQPGRLFHSAWARHDVGVWDTHWVTTFETKVEVLEFQLLRIPVTTSIWYQHRQEFHHGDYDNTSYSVIVGGYTPLGVPVLGALLARGEPFLLGLEFLHRSDHALDPPEARLTPSDARTTPQGRFMIHSSSNIWRLALASAGWNEPYRYQESFDKKTRWLGIIDWRATLGYARSGSQLRGNPGSQLACQIAVNVDIASIEGVVLYAQGAYSSKQETPIACAEVGLKRPAFRVFGRWEDLAIKPAFSKGGVFYLGFGLNL